MTIVLAILLSALLVKDVAPLGDRYLLRGLAEGLAFLAGALWLASKGSGLPWKRYWLLIGYMGVLVLTIEPTKGIYGIVQVASLAATILFCIAYAESTAGDARLHDRLTFSLVVTLIVICGGSLVLLKLRPEFAYVETYSGPRFKGLFSMPGMMGTAAGLLVGMSSFGGKYWMIRLVGILAAAPCLFFTGSRTFWVASVLSLGLASALYVKRSLIWLFLGGGLFVAAAIVAIAGGVHLSQQDQAQVLRSDSLENLSGRTAIWNLAFKKFQERPMLGFGFNSGEVLEEELTRSIKGSGAVSSEEKFRYFSLHNGYVQALLDSGMLGASLYVAIMITAAWKIFRCDGEKRYGAMLYCAVFFLIANLGETIVFGAATFQAVFYWYLAALCFGMRKSSFKTESTEPNLVTENDVGHDGNCSAMIPSPVRSGPKYPILSYGKETAT